MNYKEMLLFLSNNLNAKVEGSNEFGKQYFTDQDVSSILYWIATQHERNQELMESLIWTVTKE